MNLFLNEALSNFKQTGAVCGSSKYLVNKILNPINFSSQKKLKILELGPGNGAITKSLLSYLGSNCELIVFEVNKKFCEELNRIEDSRLNVINDCASNVLNYTNTNSIDFVVSSLPLAQIDRNLKLKIINQTNKTLKNKGVYIQYQYSLLDYSLLKTIFRSIEIKFILLNFPPAFIYNCK